MVCSHLGPRPAASLEVNEDAFGVLEVRDDSLRLEMKGSAPESLPTGWPTEMALPQGGRIVSTDGAAPWLAGLLYVWFYVMQVVLAPMQPVMRLLTSKPDDDRGTSTSPTVRNAANAAPESAADPENEPGENV